MEQSEEEFRIIKGRFGAGRGIQLEILDAPVSLTRGRRRAVNCDVIVAGPGAGGLSLMVLRTRRPVDDPHAPCLPQVAGNGAGG